MASLWRRLALILALIAVSWNVQAQKPLNAKGMEQGNATNAVTMPASTPKAQNMRSIQDLQVHQNARLLEASQLHAMPSVATTGIRKSAQPTEAATDYSGSWIMTYETLLEGGSNSGSAVTLVTSEAANVYVIKNFWANGLEVAAQIDQATGTITIPNQTFAQLNDGTQIEVTAIDHASGNALKNVPITGTINADGTIAIDTWWALYRVGKPTMSEGMLVAYYNTRMIRPNGKFSFTQNGTTETVPVYANQVSDNVLEVTNLLNAGLTIELALNRNLTATIALQPILSNNTATYNIVNAEIEGENVSFTTPVTTAAATDRKVITWTNWSGYGITSQGQGSWLGMFTDATLTLDNEVRYPSISTTALKGEGTKENPWLITSKDDLIYMADMVNGMETAASGSMLCTGEYFRLENDIDMSSYRSTSIANDYYHIFNGTFDGNGHTIKGLNSNDTKYAGLFGRAGDNSLITNLNIEGANINAAAFAGCVVAWSTGTVSNVNVTSSTITNSSNGVGAIGNIVKDITNCHADNCDITGTSGYVAGLLGQLNGTMSNCSATNMRITAASPKTGPSPVGGLVGLADYKSVISDSYFSGTIDAYTHRSACVAGGIVGTERGGTIERCFSVGTVRGYSADAYTGGLVGEALSLTMTDCYVNGRVDGASSKKSGGLIGYTGYGTLDTEKVPTIIRNCYSSAVLTAETYLYVHDTERRELFGTIADGTVLTVENTYYNKQLVDFGSTEYGVLTSELVSGSGPKGFSADRWVFTQNQYPRLKGLDQTEAALYSASALIMPVNSSLNKLSANAAFHIMGKTAFGFLRNGQIEKQGYYSTIDGDSLILNDTYAIGVDTLFVVNGRAQYHYFIKVAPVPFAGEGTQESPYLISTKDDLIQLSKITTVNGQTFPGTYFKMTNDIDLEYSEEFLGITCDAASTANFAGIFDGNGYTVHRMKINQLKWTTEPTGTSLGTVDTKVAKSYQGFIGRLAPEGIVRNLTLANDCEIVLGGYSGAIVGYNFGLIENCRNLADVTTYSGIYVGGITGYNNNMATARVINCYNAGNITSGRYGIGGITGVNYALVKECVNTGDITAVNLCTNYKQTTHYLVGGITGSMTGRLEDCVNYGTVSGNDRIGGLSGTLDKSSGSYEYLNDVVNCVNVGLVYAVVPEKSGALGGVSGTDGVVSGNYWDAQILPIAAAANTGAQGMNGVCTDSLTSGKPLNDYSVEIWDFTAGQYPTLKSRVAEDAVKAARAMVVKIPTDRNAYKMTGTQAALASAEGLTWTLAKGTDFTISGNTLTGPASVPELVTDTLYARAGALVKPILIKALPANPLAGTGTEQDPYLITSADDWNALAKFMAQTASGFEGEFIAITADIDFTGVTFSPLAADGVTYLNGTLDGRKHTISGIKYITTATFGGAIGTVGTTGTVRDLTLAGTITSAQVSTGGFTGRLYGSLVNCVNAINVTSTKATAGGLTATMFGHASMTDCVNEGNISGASSVGGIAGTFDSASRVTLTRSGNKGTIKGNATSAYVGGIVGTAMPAILTDCYNSGTVTVNTPTSQSFAAGIIGYASGTKESEPYVITGCRNTGNVTAKSGAAGIVANVHATASYTTLDITDCHNSGKITAKGTANTSNTANAGIAALLTPGSVIRNCRNSGDIEVGVNTNTAGIAGYARVAGTAAKPIHISGCTNSGSVTSKNYYAAGIIANAAAYTYVDSCANTGDIAIAGTATVSYAAGGIAGALTNVNAAITNSWNTGNVKSTNRAGGIVGMNAQKATITDCWNGGDITSTSTTQGLTTSSGYGIGGIAGQSASIITRCYNYGTLTGVSRVGGLVGATSKNNTQLVSCYNAGRIEAPADSCGNLVGVKVIGNGSIWNTGNAITDSYYVTDFGVFANTDNLGTAVTMGQLAKTNLGAEWTVPAEYSLPMLNRYANVDEAVLYSAAVILGEGNTFDAVTTGFNLGTPAGVQWTSSVDALTIDGNKATFNSTYTGDITLTATLGGLSRTVTLKANVITTGIDGITTDGNNAEAEYFNLQGVRVTNPVAGQIYIVRRGNTATKELYR